MRKMLHPEKGPHAEVEMPDAYIVGVGPRATRAQKAKLEDTVVAVREEVIAAMNEGRPPVFHIPTGLTLTIRLQGYEGIDEED